jgi:DNA-binding LytR/AlgR family response regulator
MNESIKILIVEDEMIIGANISLQLSTLGYTIAALINKAEDVMPHIRKNRPTIVLMDINLNSEMDGIAVAHLINKEFKIPILFLTANTDEAHFIKAKETNPYAFIAKPIKKLELQRAIELVLVRIADEKNKNIIDEQPFVLSDSIFIHHQGKMIKIAVNDILYIEADRNYSKIYCIQKQYVVATTLKDLAEKLIVKTFIRVHRSYIVNIIHIEEIATSHIVIGKKTIPVIGEWKKNLLQHIQKI